jgi:ABC-type transport system involved in cytochrome c biogenesis ATPase subunit
MSHYARTAIRRLSIRGFRSIRSLELTDLPDLVVLHGPNGAGKSNLLRAAHLALVAASLPGELPVGSAQASVLSLVEADQLLDLRPDDFHLGGLPEIRVELTIDVGRRASEFVGTPNEGLGQRLRLSLVVQQPSDRELRYWFDRAELDDGTKLGPDENPERLKLEKRLIEVQREEALTRSSLLEFENGLKQLPRTKNDFETQAHRLKLREIVRDMQSKADFWAKQARDIEARLGTGFVAERIRRSLLPKLVQLSPAYRVPGAQAGPEAELYQAFLSEHPQVRQATRRLGQRLAQARLFGAQSDQVALLPVDSATYKEKQVRFSPSPGKELPLRNLGSGEQQVILMLAQRVITPHPIAFLEEPEAHLHPTLMDPLAKVLVDSLAGQSGVPDVDQLWIATHHHFFALALEYFDVKLTDGATEVVRLPRAKAAPHFYEPGPIWEALRQLAHSAAQRDAVVFRAKDGRPVTAGEVLDSIEKDPKQEVAMEYARAMTYAMVQAMRQRAAKTEGDKTEGDA